MKNILVSLDFEKETGVLVDTVTALAKQFDSKVWLLHIAAPEPDFVGFDVGPQNERDFRTDELKGERNVLESYAHELKEKGINAQGLLIEGPTVETILKETKKLDIDLLIIGHHKRNYFYKTLVGNTDTTLVNKLNIPVLIVPLSNDFSSADLQSSPEQHPQFMSSN
jgi:nucleotide-binding universal stress UspA family protein